MAKPHPALLVAGSKEPSVATKIESVPLMMSERSWEKGELAAAGGQALHSRFEVDDDSGLQAGGIGMYVKINDHLEDNTLTTLKISG